MENQTAAQKAGFIVGNQYTCVVRPSNRYTAKGAVYEFIRDDGSECPEFRYVSGPVAELQASHGCMFISLDDLSPVPTKESISIKPHKHAELIKAWADGAEIEVMIDNKWISANPPAWSINSEYRIKPEPKPDVKKYIVLGNAKHAGCGSIHHCEGVFNEFVKHDIDSVDGFTYKNCGVIEVIIDAETGKPKSVALVQQ